MSKLREGAAAPDFTLRDVHGRDVTLSMLYKDSSVVLVFYRGEWCHFCQKQLTRIKEDFHLFRAKNSVIVALSVDSVDKSLGLVRRLGIPYYVLSDSTGEVARKYGVYDEKRGIAKPATFIIDRSGFVRFSKIGSNTLPFLRPKNSQILESIPPILFATPEHRTH